jgi:hypothetical protein
MTEMHERDLMVCRACGREERASEGYPCDVCGTFVCQICSMRGVTRCKNCAELNRDPAPSAPPTPPA